MKFSEIERLDELKLADIPVVNRVRDLPGISHATNFLNRRAGRKEVENIARILMKKYMHFLGVNKKTNVLGVNQKSASRESLIYFLQTHIQYNDEYHYDADVSQAYKNDFQMYKEQIANIIAKRNSKAQQKANKSNQKTSAQNKSNNSKQRVEPTITSNPVSDNKKEPTITVAQAAETLDKEILNPSANKDDLEALNVLLTQANKVGGQKKEQVLKYLAQLRDNEMLRDKNPRLFKAIGGKITSENLNHLIDFASFLVEYEINDKISFNGALQFLYEAMDDYGNEISGYTGSVTNDYGDNADDVDDGDSNEEENESAYQKYMTIKLSRSYVMHYLTIAARAMINSGEYSYQKNDNSNHDNISPRSNNRQKGPFDNHGGYADNFRNLNKIKISKTNFIKYLISFAENEKLNKLDLDEINKDIHWIENSKNLGEVFTYSDLRSLRTAKGRKISPITQHALDNFAKRKI